MVLQTDNLLPFLQQQFGQQPRTTQKPSTLSGADELPMPGLEGPTSDKAPLLPRARSSDSKEEKNDENPRPSKHKTKAIKGEWQFKMYTDVLHAQSSFARDELVAVARAEMQEGRREAAASRRQERLKARNARSMRSHGDTDGTGDDGEDDGAFSDDMHVSPLAIAQRACDAVCCGRG